MSFGGFLGMTPIGGGALLVLLTLLPRKGPQVLLTQLYPLFWFLLLSGTTVPTSTLSIPPRAVPSGSHPMLLWPLPHSQPPRSVRT